MFALLAVWSRRRLQQDPDEARSLGWAFYLTVAPLTALVVAMVALHAVVSTALAEQRLEPIALSQFVVWAADDISTYWENVYGQGGTFVRPEIVFFTDPVMSPCDTEPTLPAEGPFYCVNVVYVPDAFFAADEIR